MIKSGELEPRFGQPSEVPVYLQMVACQGSDSWFQLSTFTAVVSAEFSE